MSLTPIILDSDAFYMKWDFYIFLVLGIGSIIFSIASFWQAKKAKEAAENAGKIVKVQDILLDIPEIINLCQLNFPDDYQITSTKINNVMGKVSTVIGVIKEDNSQNENQKVLILGIEENVKEITKILKGLNPYYIDSANPVIELDGQIYYALEPYLRLIIFSLRQLSGNLHGQMINKN